MNWKTITQNWKTTASSILTVTLATTAALMAYPPVAQHVHSMEILGVVQVVAKVWIGLIQVDAKQPAASGTIPDLSTLKSATKENA